MAIAPPFLQPLALGFVGGVGERAQLIEVSRRGARIAGAVLAAPIGVVQALPLRLVGLVGGEPRGVVRVSHVQATIAVLSRLTEA
jgi:hypothetical protein